VTVLSTFFTLDYIVTVLSTFVFTLMYKFWLCCQRLCLLLESNTVLAKFVYMHIIKFGWIVSICVYAYYHKATVVYICVYIYDHIVTLLSAFVFTLRITYLLYFQHLFQRLWSYMCWIFSILLLRLYSHWDCIVNIYFYANYHRVTILSIIVLTLMVTLWLYCQHLCFRL